MTYAHTLAGTRYVFDDLRTLLARATPFRSGDALAGLAASTAAERVAAQMALADLPLATLLAEPVVPYEADEVTRLIADSHDAAAFAAVASLTVGGVPRIPAGGGAGRAGGAAPRPDARDGRRGQQADAAAGPDRGRREVPRRHAVPQHDRAARAPLGAAAAEPSDRRSARRRRLHARRAAARRRRCGDRRQSGDRQRGCRVHAARHARRRCASATPSRRRPACWRTSPPACARSSAVRRSIWCSSRSAAPRRRTPASACRWRCCARRATRRCRCSAARSATT